MKLYSSFLIRCWLIHDAERGEGSVIDVEHIQSGGHKRAASLSEAEEWMFEACRTGRASVEEQPQRRRKVKSNKL
jgi:hypothetical protein